METGGDVSWDKERVGKEELTDEIMFAGPYRQKSEGRRMALLGRKVRNATGLNG
jgi:hypothetical protein